MCWSGSKRRSAAYRSIPTAGVTRRNCETSEFGTIARFFLEPYRIIYRVLDNTVYVLVIADGRRDMQTLLQRRLLLA